LQHYNKQDQKVRAHIPDKTFRHHKKNNPNTIHVMLYRVKCGSSAPSAISMYILGHLIEKISLTINRAGCRLINQ